MPGADENYRRLVQGAERWLTQRAGGIEPGRLIPAILRRYGKDRTFSAPILTACALSGRFGPGGAAWKWVLPLPFELAALPDDWPLDWGPGVYAFPEVYPQVPTRKDCPPEQINLDRVLDFVTDL